MFRVHGCAVSTLQQTHKAVEPPLKIVDPSLNPLEGFLDGLLGLTGNVERLQVSKA